MGLKLVLTCLLCKHYDGYKFCEAWKIQCKLPPKTKAILPP